MAVPILANVAPAAASLIASTQVLSFEITSAPALQRVMVFVRFPGAGIEEVIWDGTAFTDRYAGVSTRTAIAGGFRYLVIRNPIWPDSPQLALYAVNTAAEELSSSWGYTANDPPTYSTAAPSLPTFSGGSPTVGDDSGFPEHDQAYFLRLAGRVLDSDYVAGLEAGEGYEVLQEQAKQFARVSTAMHRTAEGMLAAYAQGASYATGVVEFYRTGAGAGAVTVKAGSVVTSRGGRYFVTLTDAVFGALALGPVTANIRSVFQDWQHNVTGRTVTAAGVTIDGEIDTIRILVEDPLFGDPTIKVRQITDVAGGRPGMLDLLARANNLLRRDGETDESLSYRTRNLPDNLTPAAVERNLRVLLAPYRAQFEYLESFELEFQTAYDMLDGLTVSNIFTLDDPRPLTFPYIDTVPDDREQWGTFYVIVSQIQPMEDYGGMLDDTALDAAMLVSPSSHGRRAISAYDLPDSSTFGTGADLGIALDGRDVAQDALMGSVLELLQSIRAAGIVAGLMQKRS